MAKRTFEDYANGAMTIIGIAMFCHGVYKAIEHEHRENDRRKAATYAREANARLENLVMYMRKQRASKECFVEALKAAKNVIAFEVRDVLTTDNYFMHDAEQELFEVADKLIASAK